LWEGVGAMEGRGVLGLGKSTPNKCSSFHKCRKEYKKQQQFFMIKF
jgi:hypothetical protein